MVSHVTRRDFLRMMSASAVAAAVPAAGLAQSNAKRPNIVLIMADDMGFSDIGCYGGEIQTPNLDSLARNGLRFTQFYNNARCCPTRASLMTGLYPHQAGVGAMVGDLGVPSYQGYLNDSCVTIAEALRPAGYRTAMSGKWHAGENPPHWPFHRGFEQHYGLISGASNYFKIDKGRIFAENDKQIDPTAEGDFYMTDAVTGRAVKYIGDYAAGPNPFFLYVAYTSPHWPLHARPEDIAKYRGKYTMGWDKLREQRYQRMTELGLIDPKQPISPRDPKSTSWDKLDAAEKDAEDLKMAVYAAQIDRMDQGIGRIINKLKETGAFDNTLILFLADNGGCHESVHRGEDPNAPVGTKGSFNSYGVPWANASNTPFRFFKHWVHEGGISTPLIAHWPGRIQPSTITHQTGHIIDVMATCVDVAGAEYPKTHKGHALTPLEGKSLTPIFQGKQREPHQAIFWEHMGNRAVRQGKWKLVSAGEGPWELYDLEADRVELNNLVDKYPDKAKELAALYSAWTQRCGVKTRAELGTVKKKPAKAAKAAAQNAQ